LLDFAIGIESAQEPESGQSDTDDSLMNDWGEAKGRYHLLTCPISLTMVRSLPYASTASWKFLRIFGTLQARDDSSKRLLNVRNHFQRKVLVINDRSRRKEWQMMGRLARMSRILTAVTLGSSAALIATIPAGARTSMVLVPPVSAFALSPTVTGPPFSPYGGPASGASHMTGGALALYWWSVRPPAPLPGIQATYTVTVLRSDAQAQTKSKEGDTLASHGCVGNGAGCSDVGVPNTPRLARPAGGWLRGGCASECAYGAGATYSNILFTIEVDCGQPGGQGCQDYAARIITLLAAQTASYAKTHGYGQSAAAAEGPLHPPVTTFLLPVGLTNGPMDESTQTTTNDTYYYFNQVPPITGLWHLEYTVAIASSDVDAQKALNAKLAPEPANQKAPGETVSVTRIAPHMWSLTYDFFTPPARHDLSMDVVSVDRNILFTTFGIIYDRSQDNEPGLMRLQSRLVVMVNALKGRVASYVATGM